MVNHTRLDCVIGAAAIVRQALAQAIHHCRHRRAFGRRLIEQPVMRSVLADLAIESEAATASMLRLARAYDRRDEEAPFRRIATAVMKYWVCKRAAPAIAEALECLGGNGYVEESILPRLYREAPLNSIWEGSGNVICLDVLRALAREPGAGDALIAELRLARGGDRRLDAAIDDAEAQLARPDEALARRLVESLAIALQGSLLVRYSHAAVTNAFCATRIAGDHGYAFGTLPPGLDVEAMLARAWPA
jgi:putative acyl-CoA dehydrogenase